MYFLSVELCKYRCLCTYVRTYTISPVDSRTSPPRTIQFARQSSWSGVAIRRKNYRQRLKAIRSWYVANRSSSIIFVEGQGESRIMKEPEWKFQGADCSKSVCPVLCSSHGQYGGGMCHCEDGWKGAECDIPLGDCQVPDCNQHGQCVRGSCVCNPGWKGVFCDERKLKRNI